MYFYNNIFTKKVFISTIIMASITYYYLFNNQMKTNNNPTIHKITCETNNYCI